jgi:hypothetical protein
MINGMLILIVHMITVILSFVLIKVKVLKVDILMMAIIIFVPIFGFLGAVFISVMITFGRVGANSKNLEAMKSGLVGTDTIIVEAPEGENVVPLQDALIMDDPSIRRSVMMDVLMSDTKGYISVINEARMNDDVEVVHYATTAMVEISKDYELRVQEYSTEYAQNPNKEGLLDEYIAFLEQYVNSGMIQGQLLEIQRSTLMQLLAEKVARSNDPDDYVELIVNLFEEKQFSNAYAVLTSMEEKWPGSEKALKLRFRYYYETGTGAKLQELVRTIKESGSYYSREIRDMVDLWDEDKGEQRA